MMWKCRVEIFLFLRECKANWIYCKLGQPPFTKEKSRLLTRETLFWVPIAWKFGFAFGEMAQWGGQEAHNWMLLGREDCIEGG